MSKENDQLDGLSPQDFFEGTGSTIDLSDKSYKAAIRLSEGKVRWYGLASEIRRDIATYNHWAMSGVSFEDRQKAMRKDDRKRIKESLFFTPDTDSGLDLHKVNPHKFRGQVLWLEDQNTEKPIIRLHGRNLEITDSGLQLLGTSAVVSPHIEEEGVTEIIFPLWTLDPTSPDTSPFHSHASYQIENSPEPAYLHWQTTINNLVGARYALRVKGQDSISLDVYPEGYDEPLISVKPIVLPPDLNHSAQSSTQCLYFALKTKPFTPTSTPQ